MSITVKTEKVLPTLDELKSDWKQASVLRTEAFDAWKAAPIGSTQAWILWQDLYGKISKEDSTFEAHQERMTALREMTIDLNYLGTILIDNPKLNLFQAEDLIYREPIIHNFDKPITDAEIFLIFADREERDAAEEWQDRMVDTVEESPAVDPWVEDAHLLVEVEKSDALATWVGE